jgi:hypothetical protein
MRLSKTLAVFAACFGIFASPMLATATEAKIKKHKRHYYARGAHYVRPHYVPRYVGPGYAGRTAYETYGVTAEGELVDKNGWRLRDGGWDNTCLNIPWLPSQYACSAKGGY